ncbi:heavy metal-binding domain-containing protein [Balneola sp. MJW-20]|uniref:heavy metal-binding domain-containing protein n=1 Tax=Gracilimonas aurantiaca TaxID=3234185 RepID=UPI003465D5D3
MKVAAMKELERKAKRKGANAVIALKMDLDEVSGGGKSMFMLNVIGTAVKMLQEDDQSECMLIYLEIKTPIPTIEKFFNRKRYQEFTSNRTA